MQEVLFLLPTFFLISVLIWAFIGYKWNTCKNFFHKSYSYIDLSFILFYFFEQIALAILLSATDYDPRILVGFFAIVVITTASLQNKAWESRANLISREVTDQHKLIDDVFEENKKVIEKNRSLEIELSKSKNFIVSLIP